MHNLSECENCEKTYSIQLFCTDIEEYRVCNYVNGFIHHPFIKIKLDSINIIKIHKIKLYFF